MRSPACGSAASAGSTTACHPGRLRRGSGPRRGCLLDVPVHKTGTAFTKPVDPLLGKAIEAWQSIRPEQPKMLDRKTAEHVDFLFTHRAKRLAKTYINTAVIPSLCRKAAVPATDVRVNITSHRARSTIASQLYNAKEPMTLFELQAWGRTLNFLLAVPWRARTLAA